MSVMEGPFLDRESLVGLARDAVHRKAWMADVTESATGRAYAREFLGAHQDTAPDAPRAPVEVGERAVDAVHRMTSAPWRYGELFVLAPAMTAVVAAAAAALDLTGETLTSDIAPTDHGVLLLPEPVYYRRPDGRVVGVAALTWAKYSASSDAAWLVAAWSDRTDPDDPTAAVVRATLAAAPGAAGRFGPYLLADFDSLPIGTPVDAKPDLPVVDSAEVVWQSTPEGRYLINAAAARSTVCMAIAYAFWVIQAQPLLATAARAPLDRAARRKAARASIVHDTRVVMLRRRSPAADAAGGEPHWHYRVRFVVRGHWRRLIGRDGNPYRIWVHAHLKGPPDAPLLGGEKVAILAR